MKMSVEKKVDQPRVKIQDRVPVKVPLTKINEHLMCQLCIGYLVDATSIVECSHAFCRSCILMYLDKNHKYCPICEVELNQGLQSLRSDDILQKLVYKLVPGLVNLEIRKRKEFALKFKSEGGGDGNNENESIIVENVKEAEEFCFLNRDDVVSLSLEYYKNDDEDVVSSVKGKTGETKVSQTKEKKETTTTLPALKGASSDDKDKANDRRYLQCPAAVSVGLLKKFIRMKYGLSDDYRVDLLYNGDRENNLENELTLLDLSFIFKWKKTEPMCFHYRIFDRPLKTLSGKPGVKRPAPSILDKPPPDDNPPSSGSHPHGSTNPTSKQARLGGGSGHRNPESNTTTGPQPPSKTALSPLSLTKGQKVNLTNERNNSTSDEMESSYESTSSTPVESPTKTSSSPEHQVNCSSSSESPSSPLKISIKSEHHRHHRHHHHRHHKDNKHKRRKSKSKSKEKDREKERYKYNAHPNPSQSQNISLKPNKHHKSTTRDKESTTSKNTVPTMSVNLVKRGSSSASTPIGVSNQTILTDTRRANSGLEFKPIPINTTTAKGTHHTQINTQKSSGGGTPKVMKIPDSLQRQVPKSVTLIPVSPGNSGKIEKNERNSTSSGQRPNSATFTHPITNKSLHQITVTEVPPPKSGQQNANVITIEKCSPNSMQASQSNNSSSVPPRQLFNGPGSMEITKIYCDKPSSSASSSSSSVVKSSKNSHSVSVFETASGTSGKKLKGLDISITPTQPPSHRNSSSDSGFGNSKVSGISKIPVIPGVSILPQAVHNANKAEQQRKLNPGIMSFSCTKLNNESGGGRNNSNARLLSNLVQQQHQKNDRSSPSSENPMNGKSHHQSSSSHRMQRKQSTDTSAGTGSHHEVSNVNFQNQNRKSYDQKNKNSQGIKRPFESSSTMSGGPSSSIKKPRIEEKKREESSSSSSSSSSLPLDLSGRSSRLTPPGDRPPTPIQQTQASPKLSSHNNKTQSAPSINSIVENLAQKQRAGQRQQTKESISPPSLHSPSPPSLNPYQVHSDLLTLSNAAANARKLSQNYTKQQQQHHNTAMNNLLSAVGLNCQNSPPIPSPPVGMLPLLQHFGPHSLNAMMSPPGSAGMKSPLIPPHGSGGGLYGSFPPGLNGRLPSFGSVVACPSNSISPPFYNTTRQQQQTPTLKIPSLSGHSKKSPPPPLNNGVKVKTPIPPPVSKINTTNGSSPPSSKPPQQPLGSKHFSFGISNFLKDTPKGIVDPNAKAIVTSLSSELMDDPSSREKQQQESRKSFSGFENKVKNQIKSDTTKLQNVKNEEGNGTTSSVTTTVAVKNECETFSLSSEKEIHESKNVKNDKSGESGESIEVEQSLPISKLIGSSDGGGGRLGDLGRALGLVPCLSLPISSSSSSPAPTLIQHPPPEPLLLPSSSSSPPKPYGISSLFLPPTITTSGTSTTSTQQNQAVRQIPNPSLLSSRQNVSNNVTTLNHNPNPTSRTTPSTIKGNTNPLEGSQNQKPQPQSIELNMKLWIDRYESLKSRETKSEQSLKESNGLLLIPISSSSGGVQKISKEEEEVSFSASVPESNEIKNEFSNPDDDSKNSEDEKISEEDAEKIESKSSPVVVEEIQKMEVKTESEIISSSIHENFDEASSIVEESSNNEASVSDVNATVIETITVDDAVLKEEAEAIEENTNSEAMIVSETKEAEEEAIIANTDVEKVENFLDESNNPSGEKLNEIQVPAITEAKDPKIIEERNISIENGDKVDAEVCDSFESEEKSKTVEMTSELIHPTTPTTIPIPPLEDEDEEMKERVNDLMEDTDEIVIDKNEEVAAEADSPGLVIDEDEKDVIEKQDEEDEEGTDNNNEGKFEEPPPSVPSLPRVHSPTLLIGSPEEEQGSELIEDKGLVVVEMEKVAAGLRVTEASINNNNNVPQETNQTPNSTSSPPTLTNV